MLVVTGCEEINNVLGNETGGDESNASSDNGTDETSDTTAPAEVTDLSATISSGEVSLNWTDPNADDLEHVEVTWSPEDGGSQPKKIDPGTEQAQITGLTNGTEYTFTLKTADTAGNASSGVTTVATPAAPPSAPSAPSNLQLSVVNDTQIDLSWTDNAANESGFKIERDGTVVASDVPADTESYSDTGLSSNTSYDYRVRAVNAAGASAWTDQVSATTPALAGDVETFSAGGESFNMHYVPPKSFPFGTDDSGSSSVANAYWIARTEVTYGLWSEVHSWATSNGYTFANSGTQGNDGSQTDQHPVTTINWHDAMVWTNALTEYYNAQTGGNLEPVYYTDSGYTTPIRSVDDSSSVDYPNQGSQDHPYVKSDADGFRLPTADEWELAARYVDDSDGDGSITEAGQHYDGNYASGATDDYNNATATQQVAWYSVNSSTRTHKVAQKSANALGLHDMSGNVWEWNFDLVSAGPEIAYRLQRGGSWDSNAGMMRVGMVSFGDTYFEDGFIGFRPARNAE
jgi:formylglycine-generating enzyme required for sulfatase activity